LSAGLAVLLLALLSGCGQSGGAPPANNGTPSGATAGPAGTSAPQHKSAAELASKWDGLTPLPSAPPPPATKPVNTDVALPPVVSRVPTTNKVVFLTFDDGTTKDPEFVRFVSDYQLPVTAFLTNNNIKDNYGYFRQLQAAGAVIEDHTLTHPDFSVSSAARQRSEVCGQADLLREQYGQRPDLLRPPYGKLARDTPAVAKSCGMKAIVLWSATMPGHLLRYQHGSSLQPGEIILLHFRPKLVFDVINLLKDVQRQGYTVARLTDYV
jgi:peptidoglycan/xylan/chitin deacetylase (PgdA/CDA1 family)